MQLIGVKFDRFKSIEDSELATDGLVVLFGVNNSGKSNALEGVGTLLTHFCAGQHSPTTAGALVLEFAGCESPNHRDHELVRALLESALREPAPDWDRPQARKKPGPESSLDELRRFWVDLFLVPDSPVPGEERRLLFEEMLRTPIFSVTSLQVSLVVPQGLLSKPARHTAAALASSRSHPLREWCTTSLTSDAGGTGIRWPATPPIGPVSLELREKVAGELPEVVRINTNSEDIEEFLHRHLRMLSGSEQSPASTVCLFGNRSGGVTTGNRPPDYPPIRYASVAATTDSWLEETGELASTVNPEIIMQAGLLADLANQVVPGFVRELGSIGIELFPPSMWEAFPTRLRVVFRAWVPSSPVNAGEAIDAAAGRQIEGLATLGSGVSRWVCASLREAARHLGGASHNTIYLVDEPETHLHPAAADSVAEWLITTAERNAGVVIATHSPAFLNIASNAVSLVFAQPGPPTSLLKLNDDVFDILRHHAKSIGLKETDFLLLTRGFLIVEGTDDERVLKHFFGKQLAQGRVMILPIHGTGETRSLVTSELLVRLGKRMILMFDSILADRVMRARAGEEVSLSNEEEAVVGKILRQVHHPLDFHLVDNPYPDIVCTLSDEVASRVLRMQYGDGVSFPGWDQVISAFQKSPTQVSFKKFLVRYLKLPLSHKSAHEMIDDLITEGLEQTPAQAAPGGLRAAVSSAIAFANSYEPSQF